MPSSLNKSVLAILLLATPVFASESPLILRRESWNARPASQAMTKHTPTGILVHHTGSPQKLKTTLATKMKGLQRFSQAKEKLADGRMKPAWPDVPYHFYISVDGKTAEGRDINSVGDTNTGYDPTGFIQVVVEGNFETEELSEAQAKSLQILLQWLKDSYNLEASTIQAHKDKAQTACPGKDLLEKLPGIVKALK